VNKKRAGRNNSRRRAGEVVSLDVHHGDQRPVKITCDGHAHTYEIAWRDTADGPVITELLVTSRDGAPITTDSLKRINATVLARAARRYDTPEAAKVGRELREAVERATVHMRDDPAAAVAGACEWLESLDAPEAVEFIRELRALSPAEAATRVADGASGLAALRWTDASIRSMADRAGLLTQRRGRKPLDHAFLEKVAGWVRQAKDVNAPNIYEQVAEWAVSEGEREYKVGDAMVKKWVRRCKDAGLLAPDAIRQPRTRTAEDG